MVTDPQQACFEAGIKFGSLYHQFAGTPVSPDSTRSLETAIADSIENQPHCAAVTVDVDDEAVAADIAHENGYTELSGHLMEVEMRIEYEAVTVRTRMEMEDGYPLMKLVAVEAGSGETETADHDVSENTADHDVSEETADHGASENTADHDASEADDADDTDSAVADTEP